MLLAWYLVGGPKSYSGFRSMTSPSILAGSMHFDILFQIPGLWCSWSSPRAWPNSWMTICFFRSFPPEERLRYMVGSYSDWSSYPKCVLLCCGSSATSNDNNIITKNPTPYPYKHVAIGYWGEPEQAPHKRFLNVRCIYAQYGSMDISTKYSIAHSHAFLGHGPYARCSNLTNRRFTLVLVCKGGQTSAVSARSG